MIGVMTVILMSLNILKNYLITFLLFINFNNKYIIKCFKKIFN